MPINAFKKVQTTGKTTGDGFQSGFNKDLYQGSLIFTRVDGIAPAKMLAEAQITGLLKIGINIFSFFFFYDVSLNTFTTPKTEICVSL
tara:strand:- start:691 stop:954 length:264 start_codon:yes stop_codon:yes gene_type:complete